MINSLTTKPIFKTKITSRQRNKYKNFSLIFLLTISLLMLAVGLFNYVIDPYGIFNTVYLPKLNDVKPIKDNNDRLYKAVDITRLKPKTLIIGSSRTKFGINPNHPVFTNQKKIYNSGLNSADVYTIKRYLEHSIANQEKMDLVLFGVDFLMFNDSRLIEFSDLEETRIGKKHMILKDILNSLFSIDALNSSWKTIQRSLQEDVKKGYGLDGFKPVLSTTSEKTIYRFNKHLEDYMTVMYYNYHLSQKQMFYFQDIVNLCKNNNINLIVFISPSHATQWETIRIMGIWETFEQWKRELVNITPVWDFSGYNSITTEPIGENMTNYLDNSHYLSNVGNLILDRIFKFNISVLLNDFGVLITKDNIENHLANIRQQRQIWQKNRPEEAQKVVEIYNRAMKNKENQTTENN